MKRLAKIDRFSSNKPEPFVYYRIIKNRTLMEGVVCETSSVMVKGNLEQNPKKSVKINQINPAQLLQKELDIENGTTNYKHQTHQITVPTDAVFLPNHGEKRTMETVQHFKPVYRLGAFLTTIECLGEESPSFSVKKVGSFPWSKYEIVDSVNPANIFKLCSNFIGSKYHLTKDGITYLTVAFRVGCGNACRHTDIFMLRENSQWGAIDGSTTTSDLEELYSKGKNYEHISKFTNLQPTINQQTGYATLHFSRRAIVPCVENTIICNLNGQKILEVVKVNELDQTFQVSMQRKLQREKLLGILIAMFDFKLGIQ